MADNNIGKARQADGTVDTETGRNGSTGSGSGSGRNQRPDTARTTGNGTTGSGSEKAVEVEKLSELHQIKVKTPEEKPPIPETEKKKARKARKTIKKKGSANADQISAVIQTFSGIIASRPNMEQWAITKEEADSIANPLSNMLTESEIFAKFNEHSDAIALIFACATVILPRAIITIDKSKEKRKQKGTIKHDTRNQNTADRKHDENGKTVSDSRRNDQRSPDMGAPLNLNIPATVSPIV